MLLILNSVVWNEALLMCMCMAKWGVYTCAQWYKFYCCLTNEKSIVSIIELLSLPLDLFCVYHQNLADFSPPLFELEIRH